MERRAWFWYTFGIRPHHFYMYTCVKQKAALKSLINLTLFQSQADKNLIQEADQCDTFTSFSRCANVKDLLVKVLCSSLTEDVLNKVQNQICNILQEFRDRDNKSFRTEMSINVLATYSSGILTYQFICF